MSWYKLMGFSSSPILASHVLIFMFFAYRNNDCTQIYLIDDVTDAYSLPLACLHFRVCLGEMPYWCIDAQLGYTDDEYTRLAGGQVRFQYQGGISNISSVVVRELMTRSNVVF